MDKQGLDPLLNTLSRIGGWPMIMHPDEWDEQEYSWKKVDDQYTRLIGRNAFHDLRVSESDSSENEIQVHVLITIHICFQFLKNCVSTTILCALYDFVCTYILF